MGSTTIVNELTVVHPQSGGIAVASAPDVCKTPPYATPVPYPNIAFSSDLANGSVTVFVDGQSIALKDAEFATSIGDEAGSLGGVISGVFKGKAKFSNYSMDVLCEGRNVARLSDPMTMNGNDGNTDTVAEIQENLRVDLGDVLALLCTIFCWCDAGKSGKDFVQEIHIVHPIDPSKEA